jgi:hypothetical protein
LFNWTTDIKVLTGEAPFEFRILDHPDPGAMGKLIPLFRSARLPNWYFLLESYLYVKV